MFKKTFNQRILCTKRCFIGELVGGSVKRCTPLVVSPPQITMFDQTRSRLTKLKPK